jgi:NAD(P)H-hydrate epimerase
LKAFSLPPVSDDRDSIARIAAAANIAAVSGCVAILKGHRSVVASSSGEILVNSSGSSALSTAGTGDVLAGLVAALLAGDGEPLNAAAAAAFIHGLAGEMSPRGIRGFTADDLVEMIPEAMRRISPFA